MATTAEATKSAQRRRPAVGTPSPPLAAALSGIGGGLGHPTASLPVAFPFSTLRKLLRAAAPLFLVVVVLMLVAFSTLGGGNGVGGGQSPLTVAAAVAATKSSPTLVPPIKGGSGGGGGSHFDEQSTAALPPPLPLPLPLSPPPPPPRFSIVMLSYKSPKSLQKTLHSLFRSRLAYHPWLAEVVVYFQARRVGERAAEGFFYAEEAEAGVEEGEGKRGLGMKKGIDPDEALVRAVFDAYPSTIDADGLVGIGGAPATVNRGSSAYPHHRPSSPPQEETKRLKKAPAVVMGDGTNIAVAMATAKAVAAASAPLVLYLECDRPVIAKVRRWGPGVGMVGRGDGAAAANASDAEEEEARLLAAFAYAQIAAAVDHLHYNHMGLGGDKAVANAGDKSAASASAAADIFRLQLYSGEHVAFPPSPPPAAAGSRSSSFSSSSPPPPVLPLETYGPTPHQHCLAAPWYHPATSSRLSAAIAAARKGENTGAETAAAAAAMPFAQSLVPSLRDVCAVPKSAKRRMGNIFNTAYCKHWRKINHIGGNNVMPTLIASSSSSSSSSLLPFSLPQQDMCDSFCFLDWASAAAASALSEKEEKEGGRNTVAALWPNGSVTIPKFKARGVAVARNYQYSAALTAEAHRSGSALLPHLFASSSLGSSPVNGGGGGGDAASAGRAAASGLPVICLTSEDCNWTNQPTMYTKAWYMAHVAAPCEASKDFCVGAPGRASAVRQELFFKRRESGWAQGRHRVCLSQGLFVHDEVDNRE